MRHSGSSKIKKQVRQLLHKEFDLEQVTLELDIFNEDCEYRAGI